jgi:hypothetical protein
MRAFPLSLGAGAPRKIWLVDQVIDILNLLTWNRKITIRSTSGTLQDLNILSYPRLGAYRLRLQQEQPTAKL